VAVAPEGYAAQGVRASDRGGQAAPPLAAGTKTERVRVLTPFKVHGPLHEGQELHGPHGDHALTWQLTGQPTWPSTWLGSGHDCDSISSGHCKPPKSGSTSTERYRICSPAQLALGTHGPQAVHSDTSQFTGHTLKLLHGAVHDSDGQSGPGLDTVRVAIWTPDAVTPGTTQVWLHTDQSDHGDTWQVVAARGSPGHGHGSMLHSIVLCESPQARPPLAGRVMTVRVANR